jgi:hypothetical protein
MSTLPHVSPLAYAILSRLDTVMPKGEPLPPSTKWGVVEATITVTHPDGTETYIVNLDHVSVSAQPAPGAPTAAALTVAGVARMLRAARKAGALAAHVETEMIRELFAAGEPDAEDVRLVEAIRREASANLEPRKSSPSVRLVGAKAGVPAWHRVG